MRFLRSFFTRKITIAKAQLNLFGLVMILVGFGLASAFTARHFISQIFASAQSTFSVDTDTDFNKGTLSALQVNGSGTGATLGLHSSTGPAGDLYSVPITIDNTGNANTLTNYQVAVTINTSSLITAGKMLSDCRDIRFRAADQLTDITNFWIENCNTSATKIWVKVPTILGSGSTTINLYYGGDSSLTTLSSISNTFIDDISNIKAAWSFDDGTGSTVTDLSGQGNTGTWQGTLGTQWGMGKFGGGGTFNGIDNYMSTSTNYGNASLFIQTSEEAWFKTVVPSGKVIIELENEQTGNGSGANERALYMGTDGRIYAMVFDGAARYVHSLTSQNDGQWHLATATNDGATLRLYIDGVLQDSVAGAGYINYPSSYWRLGSYDKNVMLNAAAGFFEGQIDDVKVYNIVLTQSQISEIYANYAYLTPNYAGHELIRQYSSPEPSSSTGSEGTVLAGSGTWESASNGNVIDLNWNGGWGDGTSGSSTAFSATVGSVNSNQTIAFQMRTAASTGALASATYHTLGTVNSGTTFSATKSQLDGLGIGTGANRYIQVKATLAQTTGTSPTLDNFTIYYASDSVAPETNASSPLMFLSNGGKSVLSDGWDIASSPYFSWTAGSDSESGIKGYCLYLGTSNTADPTTSSPGLLAAGASPVSATNTQCDGGNGFIVSGTSIDLTTAGYLGTAMTSSTSPYYFGVAAVDNAGNVDSSFTFFSFKFDGTPPTNSTYVSCPGGSFTSLGDMSFSWPSSGPTASSDSISGLLGWQYQLDSSSGAWQGNTHSNLLDLDYIPATASANTLVAPRDNAAASAGIHVIYFRTVNVAGNNSSSASYRTCSISFGGAAPTFPGDGTVSVTPSVSTTNSYALSWPSASAVGGATIAHYYYMVNTSPPNSLTTLKGNIGTYIDNGTSTTLTASSLANVVKGTNTVKVVAIDNNTNPGYSGANFISGTFTLNSTDPDPVQNLVGTDSSIKSQSQWNVTLTWTAGNYQGSGGLVYQIYRSTDNSSFTKVGTSTGLSYVDNTPNSALYYYYVVTQDTAQAVSSHSTTVLITPTGKYTSPPSLQSGPSISNITTKQATISWSTDRNGDSKVAYGTTSGSYNTTQPYVANQVTSHSVTIDNLAPGTTYYYKVSWTDGDGNTGTSSEASFTTSPPPSVQDVTVTGIGLSSGLVTFTANGASSVKIYYGTTTAFGSLITLSTATSQTTYTQQLSGLLDGTKYFFKINGLDSSGSEYQGTILDFTTLPRPKISLIQLAQVAGTAQPTVQVTWQTNTDISSIITYYPQAAPIDSQTQVDVALLKGQHQMLLSGLDPKTSYQLVVKGTDKIGNQAVSDVQTFTTATDTRPPYVTSLGIEGASIPAVASAGQPQVAQLVVTWNTDKPATSQVEFAEGTGTSYSQKTQQDGNYTFNHLVIISGLTPSKVYHLKALSVDKYGNAGESIDTVTITPKATDNALNLVVSNLQQVFGFLSTVNPGTSK